MRALGLLMLLAAGLTLAFAVCVRMTARRLRRPPRRTYAWALARRLPASPAELSPPVTHHEWTLHWEDHRLPVWELNGAGGPSDPVAVLTPGWGESRVTGLGRALAIAPACRSVVLWDPPGLGDSALASGGEGPFLMGTREHEALLALLDRLASAPSASGGGNAASRFVLLGWSAGAGTSIVAAATSRDPRIVGVIAEAPYRLPWTPARNVIRAMGMPWACVGPATFALLGLRLGVGARWRGFDRVAHAARLACPLLVIHGDADGVCPIDDGRAIARACRDAGGREELLVVPGAGHLDLWTDPRHADQCAAASIGFIRAVGLPSRAHAATTR